MQKKCAVLQSLLSKFTRTIIVCLIYSINGMSIFSSEVIGSQKLHKQHISRLILAMAALCHCGISLNG